MRLIPKKSESSAVAVLYFLYFSATHTFPKYCCPFISHGLNWHKAFILLLWGSGEMGCHHLHRMILGNKPYRVRMPNRSIQIGHQISGTWAVLWKIWMEKKQAVDPVEHFPFCGHLYVASLHHYTMDEGSHRVVILELLRRDMRPMEIRRLTGAVLSTIRGCGNEMVRPAIGPRRHRRCWRRRAGHFGIRGAGRQHLLTVPLDHAICDHITGVVCRDSAPTLDVLKERVNAAWEAIDDDRLVRRSTVAFWRRFEGVIAAEGSRIE